MPTSEDVIEDLIEAGVKPDEVDDVIASMTGLELLEISPSFEEIVIDTLYEELENASLNIRDYIAGNVVRIEIDLSDLKRELFE